MPLEIQFSNTFLKKLKKYKQKNRKVASSFEKKFAIFEKNPRDISLKTHKLSGNLNNSFAFSVEYGIRAIFSWEGDLVVFKFIGSHDEAY